MAKGQNTKKVFVLSFSPLAYSPAPFALLFYDTIIDTWEKQL